MTTISVRKQVDADQSMMKSGRNLASLEAAELQPALHIFQQIVKLGCDAFGLNADALLGLPKGARPPPGLAEHLAVQGLERCGLQNRELDPSVTFGPGNGLADVEELVFVQLILGRERGDKPHDLVGIDGSCSIGIGEI